jgi:redox-sensitive bicupin YhaK (pirin superfamily)
MATQYTKGIVIWINLIMNFENHAPDYTRLETRNLQVS